MLSDKPINKCKHFSKLNPEKIPFIFTNVKHFHVFVKKKVHIYVPNMVRRDSIFANCFHCKEKLVKFIY